MTESVSTYQEFLARKVTFDRTFGHQIGPGEIHPLLLSHQRDIVAWAVAGGRRAIFASYGLGKSLIQLETLRLTLAHHGSGRALIICPLSVRVEFAADAAKIGLPTTFVRRSSDVDGPGIYITNYESVRDGKLDVNLFTAVSLDEASVLRSYGSLTYQSFLEGFSGVPYRFVATATPSPNRHKELIHYAAFLGIMDSGQALTRWFQRDSTKANNLTLYPHLETQFWLWLSTWAAFVETPADLGHDATGYDLPPMTVDWIEVAVDHADTPTDRDGQGHLFRGGAMDLSTAAGEKRRTLPSRIAALAGIVDTHRDDGQIVLWCDLNDEQTAIEKALDQLGLTYSSIYGSLPPDEAERRLLAWKAGDTHALIGKPVMLGQGMNLQQARRCVFAGIDHKYNDFGQALHRIQRYGQARECFAHVIYAESETEIRRDLMDKWARHKEMTTTMTTIVREHGLDPAAVAAVLQRSIGVERIEASGDGWLFANNDCIPETEAMEDDSVDLIVTSIPFANHYQYTDCVEDLGFTDDNTHFWQQMDYLTPQLLRVLAPGRIYACHVKDRINFGSVTGAGIPTVSPFHVEATLHGIKHGFDYCGLIFVETDVVRENNQTYRLSYGEMLKDGSKMGVGSPEFVLLFHKPQTDRTRGYADVPVIKAKADYSLARWQIDASAKWRSSGDRFLTPEELAALPLDQMSNLFTQQMMANVYDYESHVKIGEILAGTGRLPTTFAALNPGSNRVDCWHDVNRMLTLNGEQVRRGAQAHICPLQFDIVDRLIGRFSNPGELVFDPFGGLGTVPVRALRAGRRGRGVELNAGYYFDGVGYLKAAQRQRDMPSLFDLVNVEAEAAAS